MTISLNPQYAIDRQKIPKAVLLSIDEWNQIINALEELDDIRAYDTAKTGDQESIPFEQAVREIQEIYKP